MVTLCLPSKSQEVAFNRENKKCFQFFLWLRRRVNCARGRIPRMCCVCVASKQYFVWDNSTCMRYSWSIRSWKVGNVHFPESVSESSNGRFIQGRGIVDWSWMNSVNSPILLITFANYYLLKPKQISCFQLIICFSKRVLPYNRIGGGAFEKITFIKLDVHVD